MITRTEHRPAAKALVERRAERGSLRSEDVDNIPLLLETVTEPETAGKV